MFSVDPSDQSARTRTSRFAACGAAIRVQGQSESRLVGKIRVSYRDPIVRAIAARRAPLRRETRA
jgi:hypothetical protein